MRINCVKSKFCWNKRIFIIKSTGGGHAKEVEEYYYYYYSSARLHTLDCTIAERFGAFVVMIYDVIFRPWSRKEKKRALFENCDKFG